MGFSIIVGLDQRAGRALEPGELGGSLRRVLGTNSYPSGGLPPLDDGPWRRAGAVDSNSQAGILLSAAGPELVFTVSGQVRVAVRPSTAPPASQQLRALLADRLGGSPEGFAAQLQPAQAADLARRLARGDRAALEAWAAAGAGAADPDNPFVAGPAPVEGMSLWRFSADALAHLPDDVTLGGLVLEVLDDRWRPGADIGGYVCGFEHVGVLTGSGPVGLIFSGNRVCLADRLTEREAEVLILRLERFR